MKPVAVFPALFEESFLFDTAWLRGTGALTARIAYNKYRHTLLAIRARKTRIYIL